MEYFKPSGTAVARDELDEKFARHLKFAMDGLQRRIVEQRWEEEKIRLQKIANTSFKVQINRSNCRTNSSWIRPQNSTGQNMCPYHETFGFDRREICTCGKGILHLPQPWSPALRTMDVATFERIYGKPTLSLVRVPYTSNVTPDPYFPPPPPIPKANS